MHKKWYKYETHSKGRSETSAWLFCASQIRLSWGSHLGYINKRHESLPQNFVSQGRPPTRFKIALRARDFLTSVQIQSQARGSASKARRSSRRVGSKSISFADLVQDGQTPKQAKRVSSPSAQLQIQNTREGVDNMNSQPSYRQYAEIVSQSPCPLISNNPLACQSLVENISQPLIDHMMKLALHVFKSRQLHFYISGLLMNSFEKSVRAKKVSALK